MSESNKILVVDDDDDVRESMSHYLTRKGYTIVTAASGNEGFEKVKSDSIDLIVTDCRMPNGTGLDLIDNVKTLPPEKQAPIIMISGFSDVGPAEVIERGAEVYLSKPVDRKNLLKAIKHYLTESSSGEE